MRLLNKNPVSGLRIREHLNESSHAKNWSFEALLLGSISMKAATLKIGVLRQEGRGKRKKEGARRSVFTNMRCSQYTQSCSKHRCVATRQSASSI